VLVPIVLLLYLAALATNSITLTYLLSLWKLLFYHKAVSRQVSLERQTMNRADCGECDLDGDLLFSQRGTS